MAGKPATWAKGQRPVGQIDLGSETVEKVAIVDGSGNQITSFTGGAATIADGADVAEGATSDAAVVTDTTGTVSGKLRGLVKWAFERMPASLGSKTSANSLPVVVASDQVTPINNGKTITYVSVAQGAAGTTVLAAADAAKKHKVVSAVIILDVAGSVKFTDSSGDLTGAMPVAANGGFVLSNTINPYTETGAINRALNLVTVTGKAFGVVGILTE